MPENKVTYRAVKIGRLTDGLRIVQQGLKPGENVVVNGLQRVHPGMVVAPQRVAMDARENAEAMLAQQARRARRRSRTAPQAKLRTGVRRTMNFARFFIDRPIFAAVLSIIIFLVGAIAMWRLPISEYPEVVPPSVVVRAPYPGANPKVIAETVAAPLEQEINGVENMLYMSSQATSDGRCAHGHVPARHRPRQRAGAGAEPRRAGAAAAARRRAPHRRHDDEDLARPAHGRAPHFARWPLRQRVSAQLRDAANPRRAARIQGMGEVRIFGAGDYSMRVWLDPERLASRGLTASDVVRAIREQNVQVAAGVIGADPRPPEPSTSSTSRPRAA